jgi:endoribonuclease Dicer
MRNAKLAILSKKTNQYPMMTKPMFWKRGHGVELDSLYLTVISLDPARPLQKAYRSVLLLTRETLPQFPEFPIYLEDDVETTIRSTPLTKAFKVSPSELNLMTVFTLRMFRDLYNKTYEQDTATVPYWLLPSSTASESFNDSLEPFDAIDWDSLHFVNDHDEIPRTFFSSEDMVGRFVYDRWNGKYRYFLTGVNKKLSPSDPVPSFLPRRRHMENIMSYGLSLFKNARTNFLNTCDWQQSIFDAELVSLRRNLLGEMTEAEKKVEDKSVVCLEYTVISAVSFFPIISHHSCM